MVHVYCQLIPSQLISLSIIFSRIFKIEQQIHIRLIMVLLMPNNYQYSAVALSMRMEEKIIRNRVQIQEQHWGYSWSNVLQIQIIHNSQFSCSLYIPRSINSMRTIWNNSSEAPCYTRMLQTITAFGRIIRPAERNFQEKGISLFERLFFSKGYIWVPTW